MAQQPKHGDGNLNLLYKIADNTYDISQNGGSPSGLGTMSTQDADNVSITGGDLSGVTINADSLEVGNAVTADLYVGPNGNVGIGTETTTEKLTVNGNIDISNGQIKNLGVPLDDTDAATKLYVDTAVTGSVGATGPLPWNFIGVYDNGVSYNLNDAVTYAGGYYYRTGNPLNPGYAPTPGSINASWTPVADGGATGLTGATGPATGVAGGDLSGNYPDPSVVKLQGNDVSNAAPSNGQVLQWNGTAWVPGAVPNGGSGGGGLVYFLNYQNTTGISPTTGLPTSPVAVSQLGRNYDLASASITSAPLTNGSYTLVCGFVTIVGEPNVTEIPAGLWDFNIWADVSASSGALTQFQIRIYKYDSIAGTYTSIANSDDIYIYDPSAITQYIGNVTMPQTTILATDRIYIELWAQKNVSGARTVSFHFDSLHPSHFHTTLPSVSGSGVVKVVNGVFQSPASTIVNADVDASAAISQSKISNLTSDLLGKARTSDVQIFASSGNWIKPAGAKSVNVQLLGGGGGGGSGRKDAALTTKCGGGGGAGGGFLNITIPASVLSATESVTIGAGGTGGAGVTTSGLNGVNGVAGGSTTFSSLTAPGGNFGGGGTGTSGAGGVSGLQANQGGAAGSSGVNGGVGSPSAATSTTLIGGAGGGGGGGVNAASVAAVGGSGGRSNILNLAGGTFGPTGSAGGAGQNNTNATSGLFVVGSGGGGGGGGAAVSGGAGGNGGFPAGGGGGGGATETGTTSGAGGVGGDGLAIITTYF